MVFQLSQVRGTTLFAAATATVLAVHAPANGHYAVAWPLPRVGERGPIQLRDGVITDSLTWENYCDWKAEGEGQCGA